MRINAKTKTNNYTHMHMHIHNLFTAAQQWKGARAYLNLPHSINSSASIEL